MRANMMGFCPGRNPPVMRRDEEPLSPALSPRKCSRGERARPALAPGSSGRRAAAPLPSPGLCRRFLSVVTAGRDRRGMTLIEVMVAVALLSVIMLGLTAMFSQTRKAFTLGLANVEYQEAGRAAMEIITREVQQTTPTDYTTYPGTNGQYGNGLNFYVNLTPGVNTNLVWQMIGTDHTNFSFESLFFVTRYNQQWKAIGYRLMGADAATGVGTLYRYEADNVSLANLLGSATGLSPVSDEFMTDPPSPNPVFGTFGRVVDNVVDFRVRAYDKDGQTIFYPAPPGANRGENAGDTIFTALFESGDINYIFASNAVPAYVEVELGVMETPTVQRLQVLTNTPVAYWSYLTNHAAEVHIFRQRISIPAVDPSVYPTE